MPLSPGHPYKSNINNVAMKMNSYHVKRNSKKRMINNLKYFNSGTHKKSSKLGNNDYFDNDYSNDKFEELEEKTDEQVFQNIML